MHVELRIGKESLQAAPVFVRVLEAKSCLYSIYLRESSLFYYLGSLLQLLLAKKLLFSVSKLFKLLFLYLFLSKKFLLLRLFLFKKLLLLRLFLLTGISLYRVRNSLISKLLFTDLFDSLPYESFLLINSFADEFLLFYLRYTSLLYQLIIFCQKNEYKEVGNIQPGNIPLEFQYETVLDLYYTIFSSQKANNV